MYTREQINQFLIENDDAVERAILILFQRQTDDEQQAAGTRYQNSRGFNWTDAKAGTRFARWLMGMDDYNRERYPKKSLKHWKASRVFRRHLKGGESVMDRARRIALKHSKQLVEEANNKEG